MECCPVLKKGSVAPDVMYINVGCSLVADSEKHNTHPKPAKFIVNNVEIRVVRMRIRVALG